MRDDIIWGPHITELQARWRRPVDPGGLDHLNDLLRDHLHGLVEWRDHAKHHEGAESSLRPQELATRLRELADVHRQFAECLEDLAEAPRPAPAASAVHAT